MKTTRICFLVVTGFILGSCGNQAKKDLAKFQTNETTASSNIEVVQNFFRLLDRVSLDSVRNQFASNHEIYFQSVDESVTFDDMEPLIEVFYTSFPDYKHETESIFASGDMVTVRLKFSGTQQSKFMGIEAKGKPIQYRGIFIFQLADGKISKIWGVEDELTMMTQLGLEFR